MVSPGVYRDFFMDFCGEFIYIKKPAMILTCLLAVLTVFPSDTAAKDRVKALPVKTNHPLVVPPKENEVICIIEEEMPVFPGGENALNAFLKKNIKYPAPALKTKVSGTIFVQFTVSKTGVIGKVHTIGQKKGYGMEEEAIRVVSKMPKWKPCKMGGKYTDVLFNLPIRFEFTSEEKNKKVAPVKKATSSHLLSY